MLGPVMEPAIAITRLEELKQEAINAMALYQAGEAAREAWKAKVQAVLNRVLGVDSELAGKMRSNRYGLMMFTADTPASAWERAFVGGVETAIGYIDAAIFELGLFAEASDRRRLQPEPSAKEGSPGDGESPGPDRRAVFVIHGRNEAARDAIFDFLRSLGLLPIEWSQAVLATGRPSPYVGDILNAAFRRAQAVLVLMTPDDEAQLRTPYRRPGDPQHETELTPQARPNVLFEAGMAMAWDENRTVLVELGRCRPFSDIGGRHVLRLDNSTERRQDLAQRLATAGLEVDTTGTDWHSRGSLGAS